MNQTKRQSQVGELIRRNMSDVLRAEALYIYGAQALVSVTRVLMTSDLGIAKVYLSIYNVDNQDQVIGAIIKSTRKLRHGLAKKIKNKVRRIPEIDFYLDETFGEIERVDDIFDVLKKEDQLGKDE